MSTTTPAHSAARTTAGPRLSFAGTLNSEWIKLTSLRSTLWCYIIMIALTVLLGLLIAGTISTPSDTPSHDAQQATWVSAATLGINFSQLVVAVLGALVITGEYGTGMIRSTFTAVPARLPAVIAKALVFGAVTFVLSLVSLIAAAAVTAPLLGGKGITADWADGNVWLALLGGAGYLALIGMLALAIGLIVRSSAGGIAAALGLILVVPIIFSVLGGVTNAVWPVNVNAFLPSQAGGELYSYPLDAASATALSTAKAARGQVDLSSWEGLLVLVGWFVVAFVVGAILVKRRDA